MYCTQCGRKMPDHFSYCPFCGAPSHYMAAKIAKETGTEPDLKNYNETVILSKAEESLTVEAPAAGENILSAEEPAAGVNVASAEEPAADVNVASEEKPAADVNVASEEKPAADVNVAPEEKSAADVNVASGEKAAAGMNVASGEKAADVNVVSGEKAAADVNVVSGENAADGVNVASGEKAADGVNVASGEKPAAGENRPAATDHDATDEYSKTESIPAKVFNADAVPANKVDMDAAPTELMDSDKGDKGPAYVGVPGTGTPDKGPAYAGVPGANIPVKRVVYARASDSQKTGSRPTYSFPLKKEKLDRKKILTICGVVVVVILAAVLLKVFDHNNKVKKYNEGVAQLESRNYEEAVETFTELGSFEDSEYMAAYAQMEIDYLTLDDLVAAGDYARVVEILKSRSMFYGDSDTGIEAAALADEYEVVLAAHSAMNSGDYAQAVQKFDSLTTLKDDYAKDKCLCNAYIEEDEKNWVNAIVNLYAIQDNDTDMDFLQNPQSDEEIVLSDAYYYGEDLDPDIVDELLQTDDEELEALKTTAITGLRYNNAKKLLDAGKYADAMEAFEALGDFEDSAALYEEAKAGYAACGEKYAVAEEYYENGEYFKARKEFLSISGYKDADERAEACIQPLPENGSMKYGNGGIAFTIYSPDITDSVLVRIYDSDGDAVGQVFLHPDSNSTVSLAAGTYTIKVAYGTEWYGEIDLFGDNGVYYQLLNGSDTEFNMANGYTYSLELLTAAEGNVGHQSLGGADSM